MDRIRKLRLTHGRSWSDYLDQAAAAMNTAVHSTIGFTPEKLWTGADQQRELVLSWTKEERESMYDRQRLFPKSFQPSQIVLVFGYIAVSSWEDKFRPLWRGPFKLLRRLSPSLWEGRRLGRRTRGWKGVWKFHEDQLQRFICFSVSLMSIDISIRSLAGKAWWCPFPRCQQMSRLRDLMVIHIIKHSCIDMTPNVVIYSMH